MMKKNTTLNYYNEKAAEFILHTKNINFAETQNRFLNYIIKGGYILDFGCGSGRDSKYFLEKGYQVDAIDGCEKLCELAAIYSGVK